MASSIEVKMPHRFIICSIAVTLLLLIAFPQPVNALPAMPSNLYGTVKVNGENVPDGTLVEALIDDLLVAEAYTQTYQGDSVYSISISGDDSSTTGKEGGVEGDVINLRIGGLPADQTSVWHGSANIELNLTIQSGGSLNTPQVTPTPVFSQTPINLAHETPIPGEPVSETAKSIGPTGTILMIIIGITLVLLAGIVFWIYKIKK